MSPFQKGRGGPGGWWIAAEPELHFIHNTEVNVPDLAAWRRSRLPRIPKDHRFAVVPDWVREVLSPSTESRDREVKMPIYAQFGVAYAWLIDPRFLYYSVNDSVSAHWVQQLPPRRRTPPPF